MGLLDDAIREHLDLKRRRGADPAEIERDEREALGPVRRNRDPALAEDADPLGEAEPFADAGPAPVGSAQDEPDGGIASDLVDEGALTVGDASEYDTGEHVSHLDEEPPLQDDAPATRIMRAADLPEPADGTAEFDVAEAFADDEEEPPAGPQPAPGDDEDMLEETPEFLQDTPDHDRLWFEQRPPRDFDFDG